ncbi:splicing regulatory glutamine/lysine-rich protein 1-like [Mytilus trossulus]|uniref:splicing regulatory glutamine/lysine-rich protein 1-like n=1 Tax=Mytilus trossulus TaxID=6551 RepID=UPI003004CB38
MVDFNYNNFTHEGLESEKKKLIVQLKEDSISNDGMEFWAKAETIQEQYEDPYRRLEYTSRRLFTQFKKEAQTESELKFWTQLEEMRGAYKYADDEGFIFEDLDEETEDEVDNVQTEPDAQQESGNGQDGAGNHQDNFKKHDDEQKKQAETAAIKEDSSQTEIGPSSLSHIHQKEDSTWIDNFRQNDIELNIPDKNERKVMEKGEKKKDKRTNKLIIADKKRRQKENNQSKQLKTKDGRKKAKKSTFSDFMRTLTSCFRKPKVEEE